MTHVLAVWLLIAASFAGAAAPQQQWPRVFADDLQRLTGARWEGTLITQQSAGPSNTSKTPTTPAPRRPAEAFRHSLARSHWSPNAARCTGAGAPDEGSRSHGATRGIASSPRRY